MMKSMNYWKNMKMTDKGTMQDHIDDLLMERKRHLRSIMRLVESNRQLRLIAANAYNTAGGHIKDCDPSDCCCGYQQFQELMKEEQ